MERNAFSTERFGFKIIPANFTKTIPQSYKDAVRYLLLNAVWCNNSGCKMRWKKISILLICLNLLLPLAIATIFRKNTSLIGKWLEEKRLAVEKQLIEINREVYKTN